MAMLLQLWLPIILSAVFVFIVSSVLHMAIPLHKGDYQKLPNEEGLMEAMRSASLSPGHYMFPCAGTMAEAQTPEMVEKFNHGPVGFATVLPSGMPSIGKSLIQWFVYTIIVGILIGYVGTFTLQEGASFMDAFRLTGTVAIMVYSVSSVPDSIWKGLSWAITGKFVIDGIAYGLVTGLAFGWLWP